jgi:electron transfer flavoprotein beta subunit
MKIAACIKQVPDTEITPRIKPDGSGVNTDMITKYVISPYDEFAVTEAVKIQKQFSGELTAFSIGTTKAQESLRKALAMGADKAVLLKTESLENVDGNTIAVKLAEELKAENYDIIFLGKKAADDEFGVVGGALAALLDLPYVHAISKLDISEDGKSAVCERACEEGTMVVETPLPAVLSCEKGINEPKPVPLPAIMKAKKKPMDEKDANLAPSKITLENVEEPPERGEIKMIEGEIDDQVNEMVRILKEEAKIL